MKKLLLFLFLATPDAALFNPKRAVPLQGTSNFRDLGGYPAAGGEHVKWRRLYRSADIRKLIFDEVKTAVC